MPAPTPPPFRKHIPPTENSPDKWYLQDENGRLFGPVYRAQLDQWFADGRITANCMVMEEGGLWLNASDVYVFQQFQAAKQGTYCSSCGHQSANVNAIVCLSCGAPLNQYQQLHTGVANESNRKKITPSKNSLEPGIAVLLSLLLIGLPQIMMGQVVKGVIMLVVGLFLGALTGCIACIITWPVGAIDAYCIASKLKDGHSVDEWEFF